MAGWNPTEWGRALAVLAGLRSCRGVADATVLTGSRLPPPRLIAMTATDLHRIRHSIPAGLQHGASLARSSAAHRHPRNATRQT